MALEVFDRRPILVAVAGPNGAGKTTFFHAHLKAAGLRFVNADVLADDLGLGPYAAMRVASALRRALMLRRESFAFETVFSDPARDKLEFLKDARASGYTVVLCYVGLASPKLCEERIAMRVTQGGHDVPHDKVKPRYLRSLANLKAAIRELPHVLVFDNSNLSHPFRQVAVFEDGHCVDRTRRVPSWLQRLFE